MRSLILLGALCGGCSISDVRFSDGTRDGGIDADPDAVPGTRELVVSAPSLAIVEGATAMLTVALSGTAPAADVIVTLTADNGAATPSPPTLTFTPANFETPQPVAVTATVDGDFNFAATSITITAPEVAPQTTAVRVIEPDILELSAITGVVCPGESQNTSVRLKGDPLGTLTVATTVSGTGLGSVDPASFVFDSATYSIFQGTTVTGQMGPGSVFVDFADVGLTPLRYRLTVRGPSTPICNK